MKKRIAVKPFAIIAFVVGLLPSAALSQDAASADKSLKSNLTGELDWEWNWFNVSERIE